MEAQCSSRIRVSPYARYSSHGTMTAASPSRRSRASRPPGRACPRIAAAATCWTPRRCPIDRRPGHAATWPRNRPRRRGTRRQGRTAASRRSTGSLPGGAVGGDVAGVAPEAPDGGSVEPVHPVVAAREPPGAPHVGVHHDAGDRVGGEVGGMAVDADVLESVGGVPGLEATRQPVGDDRVDLPGRQRMRQERQCRTQVLHRHVAVLVEPLPVGERDLGACRAEAQAEAQARPGRPGRIDAPTR